MLFRSSIGRFPLRIAALTVAALVAPACDDKELPSAPFAAWASTTKATPDAVSADGEGDEAAWALFDRSRSSQFVPASDNGVVTATFDSPIAVDRIKVFGPAPYRLSIASGDGRALVEHPVDLSRLEPGWTSFDVDAAGGSHASVRFQFDRLGGTGDDGIAELEIWAAGDAERARTPIGDRSASAASAVDVAPSSQTGTGELDLGASAMQSCGTLRFDVPKTPGAYRRAFLAYRTEHAFRPFVLERSINGRPIRGGHWLTSFAGGSVFVDSLDPETLERGDNEVHFCLPHDATSDVHVEDLAFVGELDTGANSIVGANVGDEEVSTLVDRDLATGQVLRRGESVTLSLDRTTSIDAVVVHERGRSSSFEFLCEGLDGRRSRLEATARSTDGTTGRVFVVAPRTAGCAKVQATTAGSDSGFIGEIEVVGSGANERIDWPSLVVSSALEHFGDVAVVEGWVRHPPSMTGAFRTSIDGASSETLDDAFGLVIRRATSLDSPWSVTITSDLPDGRSIARTVVLAQDSRGAMVQANVGGASSTNATDAAVARYGRPGASTWSDVSPAHGGEIRLGTHVHVRVPEHAVGAPTRITLSHLDSGALPPLDPSLINVTAPRDHAYEFLPHGQRFLQPVNVTIPFDPSLLPEGTTPDDVKTYFFDEYSRTWQPLQRANVDAVQGVVESLTDHFTVMINAVLTVPETPTPLSFDPTSLSSLAAGDPAANVDFIAPPEPNANGDATVHLPLWMPAGRGAYSPSLSIDYSSSAENGWLGRGWNVRLPSIDVDTRYGVPTYAADDEPHYLFDGEPLIRTDENDGPRCPNGRRYRPRVERQFSHIQRCGTDATNYYWEVRTTAGTTFSFGDRSVTDGGNAALRDPSRSVIAAWFLRRVEDANGNRTDFAYAIDSESPEGGEPSVAAYPARIDYTSHRDGAAAIYHVDFALDDATRSDAIVSGRLGFKTLIRKRLRSVRVRLDEDVIREYVLVYRAPTTENGTSDSQVPDQHFYKSLLESVHVYGVGGCSVTTAATSAPTCASATAAFFYAHRFEYFEEEAGFEDVEEWSTEERRSMTEAFSVGANAHLYVGLGLKPGKTWSAGPRFGVGGSMRQQQVAFHDLNGDGLVDQIIKPVGEEPYALLNHARPGQTGALSGLVPIGNPGAGSPLPIHGMRQLGRDVNVYFSFGAQVFIDPVSASGSWTRSISSGRAFLTDLDGDGFVDLLDRRTGNRYGGLRAGTGGTWSYEFDSSGPQFGAFSSITASSDSAIGEIASETRGTFFIGDPVRRWVAPYTGRVTLEVLARRLREDTSEGGAHDGAFVELWRDPVGSAATELVAGCGSANAPCRVDIGASDLTAHRLTPDRGLSLDVSAGDVLYLRVGTNADVPYERHDDPSVHDVGLDAVRASFSAAYERYCDPTGSCMNLDAAQQVTAEPDGGRMFSFETRTDFRLAGGMPNAYSLPVAGDIEYRGHIVKATRTSDDVRVCVQLFHTSDANGDTYDDFTTDVPCTASRPFLESNGALTIDDEATGSTPLEASFTVRAGDLILVRMESDLASDPAALSLGVDAGGLAYTQTCDSNGVCHDADLTCCTAGTTTGADSCSNDGASSGCVCLDASKVQGYIPAYDERLTSRPFAWVPSFTGRAYLWGDVSAMTAGGFVAGVRDGSGALLAKATRTSCPPARPDVGACTLNYSFAVDVTANQPVYIDLVGYADGSGALSSVTGNLRRWIPPAPGGTWTYETLSARRVYERRPPDSAFGGGYRGFSYFVWNESQPFEPHRIPEWRDADEDTLREAQDADPRPASIDLEIPKHVFAMRTQPSGTALEPGIPSWVGPSEDAYLTAADGHAARTGGRANGTCGAEDADVDSGLAPTDYARLSVTNSVEAGGGLAGLNASISAGWTKTTTDVFDVDGDGIADAVTDHGIERGVIHLDGRTDAVRPALPQTEAFRLRRSRGYSIGLGINPSVPDTTSAGRPLSVATRMPAPSLGAGVAVSRAATTRDFVDVNGDGLPDRVSREPNEPMRVELNLGHRFAAPEMLTVPLFTGSIDAFAAREGDEANGTRSPNALDHETTVSTSVNLGLATPTASFGASLNFNLSSTRAVTTFADINGDGLPDMVFKLPGEDFRVAFNLGNGFTSALHSWHAGDWGTALGDREAPSPDVELTGDVKTAHDDLVGPDVVSGTGRLAVKNGSRSFEVGAFFNISIPTTIAGLPFIQINPGLGASYETDEFQLALMDVDGDGAPDHVIRRGDRDAMYVKRNRITGREGLLRAVVTPLGGRIALDYERTANCVDMPHSRQVLSRVEIDDGVELGSGFESPNVVSTIRYEDGYYDRAEADFFGFARVIVDRMNGNVVHTRTTMTYENRNYHLRGTMLHSITVDGAGRTFGETVEAYTVVPVRDDEGDVEANAACVASLHPRLPDSACAIRFPARMKTTNRFAEGDHPLGPKESVEEWTNYDRFGHVLHHVDHGDDARTGDEIATDVLYRYDTDNWIVARPRDVLATSSDSPAVVRHRTATYDAHGNLKTIAIATGGEDATTSFDYDTYGNIETVTTPPDENEHSQTYDYVYDSRHHKYPTSITDAFGLSSSATYDLRFGLPGTTTDANASSIARAYDSLGRLASVRGPYDGLNATIEIGYVLAPAANGIPSAAATTINRASPPPGYSGPTPPSVTTIVVADGLGQELQRSKSSVVGGVAGTATTTRGRQDALGRAELEWLPAFSTSAPAGLVAPTCTHATGKAYDVLDRATRTSFPDGTVSITSYDLAIVPTGAKAFRQQSVDGNGHARESFFARAEELVAFVEHPSATASSVTQYRYNAFGDLVGITDAEGNISSIAYDARGLMTSLANPDTGLIEIAYDLMGNAIRRTEPNHRAMGRSVHFLYDRGRLVGTDYPSKPDVAMEYGVAGAAHFGAGRVVRVTDETGSVETRYGALGEVVHERRVVMTSTGPHAYGFETSFVYDSLNRLLAITYPDGEVVTNSYDGGGALAGVSGTMDDVARPYASSLEYDVLGHRTRLVSGNGVESRWTFDPRMQRLATASTRLASSRPVQALSYGYDAVGNVTSMTSALPTPTGSSIVGGSGTWSMTYDGVDRLRTANASQEIAPRKTTSYSATFDYSPSHNLVAKTREHVITQPGGATTRPPGTQLNLAYAYAPTRPHAPVLVGDLEITYDSSGNPLERRREGSVQELVWDDDGRLVEVHQAGTYLRNQYDAIGRRVIKRGRQGETLFVSPYFDHRNGIRGTKHIFAGSARVASVAEGFDAPNVEPGGTYTGVCGPPGQGGTIPGQGGTPPGHCPPYVPPSTAGGGEPSSPSFPARTYYFHLDHLGSTSVLTNDEGGVHEYLEYFPDGEVWIDGGPQNPVNGYRFSGKMFDPETGWYDFGQRFYDPSSSLWLGVDPALAANPGTSLRRPIVLSPYAYAGLSPLMFVDPDGRDIELSPNLSFRQRRQVVRGLRRLSDDGIRVRDGRVQVSERRAGKHAAGTALVRELANESEHHVTIGARRTTFSSQQGSQTSAHRDDPFSSTISIDFRGTAPMVVEVGGALVSSADQPFYIRLAHELGHGVLNQRYGGDSLIARGNVPMQIHDGRGRSGTQMVPFSEVENLALENRIRAEHGLPRRAMYCPSARCER